MTFSSPTALVTKADVAAALERQKIDGGRLGDNLVALGKLSPKTSSWSCTARRPRREPSPRPASSCTDLLNLLTKAMYSGGAETPSAMGDVLKLPHRVIQLLVEQAQERKLLAGRAPPASAPCPSCAMP